MSDRKKNPQIALIYALLALVTLMVYLPSTRSDFVDYDDGDYVTQNHHVQAGLTPGNIVWAFRTGSASNWHPLTWISHEADCQFYDLKPAGHHVTSILLHIVNTMLLFAVMRRLTGATWRSAAVAAFFAWHPLHVESVAWVSERKDVLSTMFWMLTLWAYSSYAQEPGARSQKSEERRKKRGLWYVLALLMFTLGLMAKPMLVTLPFVLLLLDYWPLRRTAKVAASNAELRVAKSKKPAKAAKSERIIEPVQTPISFTSMQLVIEKVPFLVLAAVSSAVTFLVQKKGGAVSQALSLGARAANALVSYLRYVGKFLCPINLSVLYPHPGFWSAWLVATAAISLLAVSFAVIALARRCPYLLVGWLWFLGTLVPVIGLVQVGVQSMADRYMYVPMIGLLIMVCWGLPDLLAQWPQRDQFLAFGCAVALAACIGLTWKQETYWQNSERLFQHAVLVTKDNYLAYNNLGFWLDHQGRHDEAMTNYIESLEIKPNYEDAQNNLGYVLEGKGRYQEAIEHYRIALRIASDLVEAHNNLGNALVDVGKQDEAIAEFETALRLNPEHSNAHNNLGIVLAMQGKYDEAIHHLNEAVRLDPKYASAQSNLGNALAVQHKLDEASKHYEIALQLSPDEAQVHNNYANVLSEQGKLDEAIQHYQRALELNANNPEANCNLGLALLKQGKRDEALAHFREAVRLKPDYPAAQQEIDALTAGK